MFTSSMCRVARPPSAAATTLSSTTARPSSAVVAATSSSLVGPRTQRRRYSSSKPPVPPNDGIGASSQTPAEEVQPSNAEKREAKASKRRSREGNGNKAKSEPYLNLPSVPSTQHLSPQDIHLASFFSVHRPMSITTAIPPISDHDTFSSIFEPKKKQSKSRQNDVLYTLSSALNAIESASSPSKSGRQRSSPDEKDLRTAVTQASTSNAEPHVLQLDEVSAEQLASSIQEYAKSLRPFNPPPAPAPIKENDSSRHDDTSLSQEAQASPFGQVEDLEAPSGAEEGKVIEEGKRRRRLHFLERRRGKQLREGNLRQQRHQSERTMHAISVKRQRKLKMKKHKRKKFLRRTRSLRHKLNKA